MRQGVIVIVSNKPVLGNVEYNYRHDSLQAYLMEGIGHYNLLQQIKTYI